MIRVNCRSTLGVLAGIMNRWGLVDCVGYAITTRRHLFQLCFILYSLLFYIITIKKFLMVMM